ncbi:twin-arginine translocation pathway signal protein [Kribbella sandramycini]|uniref:Twin-arginine translocation pathway signal protein n=1 Tax=Kribbella sandramycini TaxID=60450 RepID=A0A7Y4KZQ1_9ACTN|nr:cobalamin-dependent protein [Kribbella sandramycini]NOL41634.1 twin-arginine translocation pathway signal protein [Kribbella sandramycini]
MTRFEHAVAEIDVTSALAVVDEALASGADPIALLTEVIGAAQRAVGDRWQRGEWSVAEEHAATAVATAATETITREVRRGPVTRGRVVVACAEREWHALPAMIIDCALRSDGWDTTLLGASTPALRLNQYLQDLGPDALAVSCSMLGSIPTARRFVEASTAAGIPILVGGPAFGSDDLRARTLGATGWAADATGAITAMRELPAVVQPAQPLADGPVEEQAALELNHGELVATLTSRWPRPDRAGSPELDPALAKDAVELILHALWAALLTADPRAITETAWWIRALLEHRDAPVALVATLHQEVAGAIRDYPLAATLLDDSWPSAERL